MSDKQGVNDVAEREVKRHYGQIYRFVRRRTHDHHHAEELTQQVFADAAAALGDGSGSPTLALLYTIAKRRFADEVRRDVQNRELALAAVPSPEAREYGPDLGAALSAAFARLPESQRQVAVLKLVRGARFAEIARTLGVTEAAAQMRFVRALQALRTELEREGIEP
jgi:RNA polymerase sigma-70 factor (ECF subfamily)